MFAVVDWVEWHRIKHISMNGQVKKQLSQLNHKSNNKPMNDVNMAGGKLAELKIGTAMIQRCVRTRMPHGVVSV